VEARKTNKASPTNKWRHGKPTRLHQPISGGTNIYEFLAEPKSGAVGVSRSVEKFKGTKTTSERSYI